MKHAGALARRARFCCGLIFAAMVALAARAENAPTGPDPLPRFVAAFDVEPLALIACRDARALSEKFGATTLAKMLADPTYSAGMATIESRIAGLLGASVADVWPVIERSVGGPVAIALLPGKSGDENGAPMRLVILVQVPLAETGEALKQQMPKAPFNGSLLSAAEFKTVAVRDLPAENKLPAWVTQAAWPQGDIVLRALPQKLCATVRPLAKQGLPAINTLAADVSPLIAEMEGSGIDAVSWGVACKGEMLVERLAVDVANEDSPFKKLSGAIREKVSGWEGLMAATPSEVDAAVLVQSDLTQLGDDRPYMFQSVERFLRGKRWSKAEGAQAEALDPARFKFLSDRMQGSFSLVARHAITAELRLTLATSIKGADVEVFRGELVKGLEKAGALFESLLGARKIGGALPLGAAFHGRGQFAAPVLGLCPGWAWLCSSSVAYQELTDAFKGQKTFATREAKRAKADTAGENNAAPPNAAASDEWTPDDAIRAEVNLDRVFIIGYTAWLLSSNEGPTIGSWRVPGDLLPQAKVFSRAMGKLRMSASRTGTRIEARSSCIFPGVTLFSLGMLQDASEAIRLGRKMAAEGPAPKTTGAKTPGADPALQNAPNTSKDDKAPRNDDVKPDTPAPASQNAPGKSDQAPKNDAGESGNAAPSSQSALNRSRDDRAPRNDAEKPENAATPAKELK